MNTTFSLLLILGLLSTQIWTTVHAAEHGSDVHEHNGKVCQIYLQRDHEDYDVPQSLATLSHRYDVTPKVTPVVTNWIARHAHRRAAPRAPPASA